MGDHEGWAQPNDVMPNGLLPNEASSVAQVLDQGRWSIAEERTLELIDCIQPNQPSEELRNAVADYVQRLIMKCFSCQVFTFGSVPLKTYLPDGDIDLTAFSKNQNVKDTWANEVRNMLENEENQVTRSMTSRSRFILNCVIIQNALITVQRSRTSSLL